MRWLAHHTSLPHHLTRCCDLCLPRVPKMRNYRGEIISPMSRFLIRITSAHWDQVTHQFWGALHHDEILTGTRQRHKFAPLLVHSGHKFSPLLVQCKPTNSVRFFSCINSILPYHTIPKQNTGHLHLISKWHWLSCNLALRGTQIRFMSGIQDHCETCLHPHTDPGHHTSPPPPAVTLKGRTRPTILSLADVVQVRCAGTSRVQESEAWEKTVLPEL